MTSFIPFLLKQSSLFLTLVFADSFLDEIITNIMSTLFFNYCLMKTSTFSLDTAQLDTIKVLPKKPITDTSLIEPFSSPTTTTTTTNNNDILVNEPEKEKMSSTTAVTTTATTQADDIAKVPIVSKRLSLPPPLDLSQAQNNNLFDFYDDISFSAITPRLSPSLSESSYNSSWSENFRRSKVEEMVSLFETGQPSIASSLRRRYSVDSLERPPQTKRHYVRERKFEYSSVADVWKKRDLQNSPCASPCTIDSSSSPIKQRLMTMSKSTPATTHTFKKIQKQPKISSIPEHDQLF